MQAVLLYQREVVELLLRLTMKTSHTESSKRAGGRHICQWVHVPGSSSSPFDTVKVELCTVMPAAAWSSSFGLFRAVWRVAESGLGRPLPHVTYIRGSFLEERLWMGAIFVLLGNLIPREGSMLVLLLRLVHSFAA